MAGLKQIKSKIRSVEKTQTVTKAMEAVSAAKMRKAQLVALGGRPYARAAASILSRLSGSQLLRSHPLTRTVHTEDPAAQRVLYVVITSDKGLAGALNSAVLRGASAHMRESGLGQGQISVVAVGKKAHDFFTARGFTVEAYHQNNALITSDLVAALVSEVTARFTSGVFSKVLLSYQGFVSTFEQRPALRELLPLQVEELSQMVADITPKKGAFSDAATSAAETRVPNYRVEPSPEAVLDVVLPKLAGVFVYHALLESQASEHSARMVAMKSASDKAEEMEHLLTLKFNKARQAAITREVSEITGGMEAMAS